MAAVIGIIFFLLAHAHETEIRGYVAYGGEIVFLLMPAFVFIFRDCRKKRRYEVIDLKDAEGHLF
jgi:hypothetical protein